MRQALSKLPLLAIKTLPASGPAYGPALKVYGRIRAAGSVGEPIEERQKAEVGHGQGLSSARRALASGDPLPGVAGKALIDMLKS